MRKQLRFFFTMFPTSELVTYFVYVYYLCYMEIMFFYEMVLLYLHVESQLKYVKPQMNPTKITSY